jgi:Cdc6-like AAA superfamily ATPase
MTSASGPNGSVGYAYDQDDNRSSLTTTVGGVANTVTYTRRLSGRIQSVTEGPRISSYSYTAAMLLYRLNDYTVVVIRGPF